MFLTEYEEIPYKVNELFTALDVYVNLFLNTFQILCAATTIAEGSMPIFRNYGVISSSLLGNMMS